MSAEYGDSSYSRGGVSLPQSATQTAPSSEGAMGSGGMRSGEMGGGRGAIMLYDNIEI